MRCEVDSRTLHQGNWRFKFEVSVGFILTIALLVIVLAIIFTGSGAALANFVRESLHSFYTPCHLEILLPPKPKAWWFY